MAAFCIFVFCTLKKYNGEKVSLNKKLYQNRNYLEIHKILGNVPDTYEENFKTRETGDLKKWKGKASASHPLNRGR